MLLVLLLACFEFSKQAPKIIFFPYPPLGCVKLLFEPNLIPYPKYLYLSISWFLVNLIEPNRQFSKVI